MSHDLLRLTALEQAEQLRRRAVSATELTRLYLDRIHAHNGGLNAFVTLLERRALRQAQRADRALAKLKPGSLSHPPFLGVPNGIKDLVPILGTRTMLGSRAYRYFRAPFTGIVARRLEGAGFVTLGKTATSELGVLPVTEPDVHPPTRNPWNPAYTPGGSSGGAGAAVAAGLAPIAQGSDGGGSVRVPAAFCHLYGFKPSLALLGNMHGSVNILGMSTMGPLARDVSDATAMLDAMRGDHRLTLLEASRRPPPRPLRIRMSLGCPVGTLDPQIAEAVTKTAQVLRDLGHHVEEVPIVEVTVDEFLPLWQTQMAAVPIPIEGALQPVTRWLREGGRRLRFEDVERRQRELIERLDATIGDADVFLTATCPVFPPKVGALAGLAPREAFDAIAPIAAYTAAFNLSWRPAASIPAGLSSEGLPYAVQIAAARGEDLLLLKLSRQLEEAMPWRARVHDAFVD
ncbi:MAG: amidase [Myxococcales bacterium]|nr:amidase [Myxococcales bacterium]